MLGEPNYTLCAVSFHVALKDLENIVETFH